MDGDTAGIGMVYRKSGCLAVLCIEATFTVLRSAERSVDSSIPRRGGYNTLASVIGGV